MSIAEPVVSVAADHTGSRRRSTIRRSPVVDEGGGEMIQIDQVGLHDVFMRFAQTLARGYRLDTVIVQLAGDICRTLGVAGAGVMIEDERGHLRFMSTSDETLQMLEKLQVQLGEGPCLLAYQTAQPVVAGDLENDPRFVRFGPLAVLAGMRAVYSFPMVHDDLAIGAINLYREEPGALTDDQMTVGAAFAHVATAFIVHARRDDQSALLNTQLQHALDSRVVIEQAKGFVMARRGVDADTAFTQLRTFARNHSQRLHDVAADLLKGSLDVESLPVVER